MNSSKVIELVVDQGLCIGCGLCVSGCSDHSLKMEWNENGFLEPVAIKSCTSNCNEGCLSVCPFNPEPMQDVRTETQISEIFLDGKLNQNDKVGRYINTYAGYSKGNRQFSSSGGIATYALTQLLATKKIDFVISVKDSLSTNSHYEYAISSNEEELTKSAKTKYYPVTLADVLEKVKHMEGRFAITGVPCFIKGIRLAQHKDPILRNKIVFLVGIVCGGVKSTFFTEYLASQSGAGVEGFTNPDFRIKDQSSVASDYSFGCLDKYKNQKTIKMRTVGDMWGTGLFKANACDFCDDVSAELADLSLGDAWIEPYASEGEGTNVIITRSTLAEQIIKEGIESKSLHIDVLPVSRFIESQKGGFNHRHNGLGYRIKKRSSKGSLTPPKRFEANDLPLLLKLIQTQRMRVRKKSLDIWKKTKDAEQFNKQIKFELKVLKVLTKTNHLQLKAQDPVKVKTAIKNKLNKVFGK